MDNKKEMKGLNEYKEKLSAVYDLSREMSLSLDLDHISKTVLNTVKKVFNFDICGLLLIDEGKNELYVKEFYGYDEKVKDFRIALDSPAGITAHVARTGESYYCSDAKTDKIYLDCCSKTKSEICVPLKIKDKVIGVLNAESERYNVFSKEDQRLLETLASQTAIAMENARLFGELSSLKEFNETIVSSLNEGIWVEDEKGFCTYANPRMREMLGCSQKEIIGKHWGEIIHPSEYGHVKKETETRSKGRASSYETLLITKNKEKVPIIISATPLFKEDKLIGTMGVLVDVTELKKAEESLQESEEKFRSIVENSHAGILIVGEDYKFIYVNDELCRILQYPREEIIGHDFRESLDEESKQLVADRYIRRQRGEKVPSRYEFNVVQKNGEKRRVEISSTVIKDSAGKMRTVSQILDIAERKRLEQQKEKSRKEAEFYADVLGHDVGNINQIISGHLYLLENAKDEETRKKNVRGIKKSIMKSARLAESMKILKIIKDTEIEKFDLNKSIERSIKEYSDREIKVNLNIDKKYYVKANDFLDKVFFNIFENAVEYTFHDPVIIDVRTEGKDDFCNVHICDNGIGISKEKREDIIENLETLSKRTGIGLYLTKKILDRLNGKFEIKDVKKGTEIVVSIPVMV